MLLALLSTVLVFGRPEAPGPYLHPSPDQLMRAHRFSPDEPVVGTYYFYWYDAPSGLHVLDADGSDALTDHPPSLEGFSTYSVKWHRGQLEDVRAASIDFILPVFWGCPGSYGPDFHSDWTYEGLRRLVKAWDELSAEGKSPPAIGMFYDTTTLAHNPRGLHVDLRTDEGKDWFYTTIRDFFSLVPARMWATIEGRPIVGLYSPAFAAAQDPSLFDYARRQFKQDFGCEPFIIKHAGWVGLADAEYSWGGALWPRISPQVAEIGPGCDDQAVLGRTRTFVDREGGAFYEWAWKQLLSVPVGRRPRMVLIETWSEFHEGTEICETAEYGRQYIEATRQWADAFRQGKVLPREGPHAGAERVRFDPRSEPASQGLKVLSQGDGPVERSEVGGSAAVITKENPYNERIRYIYFAVDDRFLFEEREVAAEITVEFWDQGFDHLVLHYDSTDEQSSDFNGSFKPGGEVACGNTAQWRTARWTVNDGRYANRCNGADFRLAVWGGPLAIREATVRGMSAP